MGCRRSRRRGSDSRSRRRRPAPLRVSRAHAARRREQHDEHGCSDCQCLTADDEHSACSVVETPSEATLRPGCPMGVPPGPQGRVKPNREIHRNERWRVIYPAWTAGSRRVAHPGNGPMRTVLSGSRPPGVQVWPLSSDSCMPLTAGGAALIGVSGERRLRVPVRVRAGRRPVVPTDNLDRGVPPHGAETHAYNPARRAHLCCWNRRRPHHSVRGREGKSSNPPIPVTLGCAGRGE